MREQRDESVVVADSVTHLGAEDVGKVAVVASHGGSFSAACALERGVRAVILNDAGVGLDGAGIAGLSMLDQKGIPAAAVSHLSALPGCGRAMWKSGVISHANSAASLLGVAPGQSCRDAAMLLLQAQQLEPSSLDPTDTAEAGILLLAEPPAVWLLDSASLIGSEQEGAIVVTGSHGALLGDAAASASKADVRAAFFNDAGGRATSRLDALDRRGIAAGTVSAASARIGDAGSSYETGRLSFVNRIAARSGILPGDQLRHAIDRLRQTGSGEEAA